MRAIRCHETSGCEHPLTQRHSPVSEAVSVHAPTWNAVSGQQSVWHEARSHWQNRVKRQLSVALSADHDFGWIKFYDFLPFVSSSLWAHFPATKKLFHFILSDLYFSIWALAFALHLDCRSHPHTQKHTHTQTQNLTYSSNTLFPSTAEIIEENSELIWCLLDRASLW